MNFLEKDLEQIIFETPNETLSDRGLFIDGKKKRQVRIGNYGIADIVTIEKPNYLIMPSGNGFHHPEKTITIYELKQNNITVSTFMQSLRYSKGISRFLSKVKQIYDYDIRIALIGREVDLGGEFIYLPDFLVKQDGTERSMVDIYTYSYGVDGIKFTQHHDYKLKNEGF